MNFLKKKITREIAIVIAMILAFMSAYNAVDGLFNYMKYEDKVRLRIRRFRTLC